jgi:2-polyprenyl-3-methyl-5-hydroxy-6-metoxy-1,4-benzoquinol methylase
VLSRSAHSVVAVDGNPETFEHARLRYLRQNLRFERGIIETHGEPGAFDVVVCLQTIEHVENPMGVLAHFRELLAPDGVAYISTPNVLTLAPDGAAKSDNPWHIREYRAGEFLDLCRAVFSEVEILGLHHARKLRAHELALRLGWDRVHHRLGVTSAFYDSFTAAISSSDFGLRAAGLDAALDFLAICS